MDFLEEYEKYIDSKEVKALYDGTGVTPIPAICAEPVMKEGIEEVHEELLGYPDSFKAEAYQMYRRYQAFFSMHYDLLANVHPLSSVGKERIADWRRAVDEYEALSNGAYPLVTTVTKGSADLVKSLIPNEFLELIENPDRHILCAMRYKPSDEEVESYVDFAIKENDAYENDEEVNFKKYKYTKDRGGMVPAGVLSFVIEEIDGEKTARIEWLYVGKEHRCAGFGYALIYEMLYLLRDVPIQAVHSFTDQKRLAADGERYRAVEPTTQLLINAGIITDEEEEYDPKNDFSPLVYFVTSLKFECGPVPDDAVHIRFSDIKMSKNTITSSMRSENIHPLTELDDLSFRRLTLNFMYKNTRRYDNQIPFVGKKRFDQDISFFYREGGRVTGLILARENYDRDIVVELVETTDNSMEAVELLITRVIMEVFRKYRDTDMVVPVYHERILKALEGHISNISYPVGAKIALMPPISDITQEEWQELVDSLQKLSPKELEGLSQALAQVSAE